MTKLDDIFSKFGQKGDAVTVVWTDANLVADVKQEVKQLMLELIKSTRWTAHDSVYTENRRQRDMALDELKAKVEAL